MTASTSGRIRTVHHDGLTFDVLDEGPRDGKPVVLLHGFPERSSTWRLVAPILHEAGLRTIALDQRGYSPGARPDDTAAYAALELAADAIGVLDALGIERAHVVGHDWGATIAWFVAGRHPERVATLTALSVPHPLAFAAAVRGDAEQRERSQYMYAFRDVDAAAADLLADDAAGLRASFGGLPRPERYVAPLQAPGALTAALRWYAAAPLTDPAAAGRITVPTTFVWSDGDHAIGRAAAEGCPAHCDGPFASVVLPGVSHWIPDEAPDATADAVLARIAA
jgi:pimeloyl-ACP methyl ester carboxylesterase